MANLTKRYSRITFFLTLLTLTVVMLGAFTRLSDAGLGCPDWPGCYGSLIVPEYTVAKDKAWIEMIHRYIAGTLGLCIFILTALAFKNNHDNNPIFKLRGLFLFTSILITFQALLGMWTVTQLLHPTIVMLHLLGGMATLSLVWLAHLRINHAVNMHPIPLGAKVAGVIGLIIVILQIALGGWLSTNYAAFACPDFPTCQTHWWPPLDLNAFNIFIPLDRNFEGGFLDHPARVTIHFIHRLGAVVTAGYLLILSLYGLCKWPIKNLIGGLLLVLGLQISLGIINIIALVPLWAAVLHNGVAALLLLFMVTLTYHLLKARTA